MPHANIGELPAHEISGMCCHRGFGKCGDCLLPSGDYIARPFAVFAYPQGAATGIPVRCYPADLTADEGVFNDYTYTQGAVARGDRT